MTSQILKKPIPYLALILAHLIWGINFIVAKITLQEFPPMSLAFLRFALASTPISSSTSFIKNSQLLQCIPLIL